MGKNAPHVFVKARPWDTFKPKVVSKKEVSILQVHKPGQKANPALEENTSSNRAYGAFARPEGADRSTAVAASRRAYGKYALEDEDALGPVDLNAERARLPEPPTVQYVHNRRDKEEAPPDTLRWNGNTGQGGRGGLAAEARRKAVEALAEAEAEEAAAAARRAQAAPRQQAAKAKQQSLTAAPGAPADRVRTEKGLQYEEKQRVRAMLEGEKVAKQRAYEASVAAAQAAGPQFHHPALADPQKVAALTDPRVTAALNAKMNAPNTIAAEQNRQRNTQRVSAERKY